jgi:uncharacterized protein YjbJ (UPF0337 family)
MGELIDKVKGKAKRVQGHVTGDRGKEAEGAAQEIKGEIEGAFDDLKTDVKRAVKKGEANHEARKAAARPDDSDVPVEASDRR